MSIFTSQIQQTIPLGEGTVTIRKLSGRHLAKAAEENQIAAHAFFERMGGEEFRKQLAAIGDTRETTAAVARAAVNPLNGYARGVLLVKGIVAVSEVPSFATMTPDAKAAWFDDELSDEDEELLARAILRLTKPALFLTADEAEAARKNAPGLSSAG